MDKIRINLNDNLFTEQAVIDVARKSHKYNLDINRNTITLFYRNVDENGFEYAKNKFFIDLVKYQNKLNKLYVRYVKEKSGM